MTWHAVFSLSNKETTNFKFQTFSWRCVGQLELVNSQWSHRDMKAQKTYGKLKRWWRVWVLSVFLLGNQPKGQSRIQMQIHRRLVLVPSKALWQKAGRTLALPKYISVSSVFSVPTQGQDLRNKIKNWSTPMFCTSCMELRCHWKIKTKRYPD
jgi:hypothetical protein